MQFMEVWGTGSTTAERWVRDGCRLLDDIRKRTDLTEQQVIELISSIDGLGAITLLHACTVPELLE